MTKLLSDWRSSQRGFLTLIGMLVVIVIIGILFVVLYGGGGGTGTGGGKGSGTSGAGGTPLGAPLRMAKGTVCKNNLSQLRPAIGMFATNNERNPVSLEELRAGVPLTCPVGGEPYQYDPNTGQVHCVHPGHEGY